MFCRGCMKKFLKLWGRQSCFSTTERQQTMGKTSGAGGKRRIHKCGLKVDSRLHGLIGLWISCCGGDQGVLSQDELKSVREKAMLRTVVGTEMDDILPNFTLMPISKTTRRRTQTAYFRHILTDHVMQGLWANYFSFSISQIPSPGLKTNWYFMLGKLPLFAARFVKKMKGLCGKMEMFFTRTAVATYVYRWA